MIQNRVIIDGKDVTPDVKEITITVTGNVNSINVDFAKEVHVKGTVGDIKTSSGNVWCDNVTGNIHTTSGDIKCEDIGGNVQTKSGDVYSLLISGNVKTISGDIKHKK